MNGEKCWNKIQKLKIFKILRHFPIFSFEFFLTKKFFSNFFRWNTRKLSKFSIRHQQPKRLLDNFADALKNSFKKWRIKWDNLLTIVDNPLHSGKNEKVRFVSDNNIFIRIRWNWDPFYAIYLSSIGRKIWQKVISKV